MRASELGSEYPQQTSEELPNLCGDRGRVSKAAARWAALVASTSSFLVLLTLLGAPSPPLFAGLVGAMVVALIGAEPLILHVTLFRGAQTVIGATVAVQIDLQALRSIGSDVVWVFLVIVATLVVSVLCGQFLRIHEVSAVTASFASVAGGASGIIALAHDFGADDRVVMVIQYLRVLLVLLTLPVVVAVVFGPDAQGSAAGGSRAYWIAGWDDYLYTGLTVGLGVLLGSLGRLPSSALLGPMLVGIALQGTPVFGTAVVPGWVQAAGFLLLGVQVGLRFTRETVRSMSRMMPMALLVTAAGIAACGALGLLLATVTGQNRLDAYLATTPGGLPAVLATSTGTSGNVSFVTAAQSMRLLLVLVLGPFVARLLLRRTQED
jgi:membrane AbrB-like protein